MATSVRGQRRAIRWLAMLGAILALGAWALGAPPGASPDDNFHVPSIYCNSVWTADDCQYLREFPGAYGQSEYLAPPAGTVVLPASAPCYAFKPTESGSCEYPLGLTNVVVNSGLYPPLFYAFAGLFVNGESLEGNILRIRLGILLSTVGILALSYAVALPWLRPALIVSWVVMTMPLGASLLASTNPSAWAIAGTAAAWGAAVTACSVTDRRHQVFAIAVWALASLMAAMSRADGAAYVGLIAATSLVLFIRQPRQWPAAAAGLAITVGSGLVVLSTGQTSNVTQGFLEGQQPRGLGATLWGFVQGMPSLWLGSTGAPNGTNNAAYSLGWFDVAVPPTTWISMLMVIGGLGLAGLAWVCPRKSVALIVLVAAAFAVPALALIPIRAVPGELVQARYLLPLMYVIFGVLLVRAESSPLSLRPVQLAVTWLALAIAGALGLHSWIRRFVTGSDVTSVNLNQAAEWWWTVPVDPMQTFWIGTAGWLVVVTFALSHLVSPVGQGQRPSTSSVVEHAEEPSWRATG